MQKPFWRWLLQGPCPQFNSTSDLHSLQKLWSVDTVSRLCPSHCHSQWNIKTALPAAYLNAKNILAVTSSSTKALPSVQFHFGSPFSSKIVVCGHCLVTLHLTTNEALKQLSLLPILMQKPFWWWQHSEGHIPLPPPPGILILARTSSETTPH